MNYTKNVNIRGAPYDFRKGPGKNLQYLNSTENDFHYTDEMESYLTDLRQLIEDMYNQNGQKSTVIVAHSLGNLHILRLLNSMSQAWKDKYVRSFISVSAPYAGAMVALESILSGSKLRHLSCTYGIQIPKSRFQSIGNSAETPKSEEDGKHLAKFVLSASQSGNVDTKSHCFNGKFEFHGP